MTLKTRDEIVKEIKQFRNNGGSKISWDKVAKHFGVSKPCVYRLVKENGYSPGVHNCQRLGMRHEVKVQACATCGEVHTKKTCPRTRNGKPTHYVVSLGYIPEDERDPYRQLTPDQRRQAMDNFIDEMED